MQYFKERLLSGDSDGSLAELFMVVQPFLFYRYTFVSARLGTYQLWPRFASAEYVYSVVLPHSGFS